MPARSQATLLAADFDLVASNRNTGSCVLAGESLRNKWGGGWHDLRAVTPRFSGNYSCHGTATTLLRMAEAIGEMTEVQRSPLTIHVHLSMQSIVLDNLIWPFIPGDLPGCEGPEWDLTWDLPGPVRSAGRVSKP